MSELLGEYRHKLDAKGRLSLPADFRKALSTNLKVTPDPKNQCLYVFETEAIIGDEDHFEIWDEQRWDEFCADVDLASLVS